MYSYKTKTLIVSNLHSQRSQLERIIEHESPDKIVLLGDYFDPDNKWPYLQTCISKFIKENLDNPKYTFILGDQDLQYLWPDDVTKTSNFSQSQFVRVDGELRDDVVFKFKWYHWLDDKTLLSHAGLSAWWVNVLKVPFINIPGWLKAEEKECVESLKQNKLHWFFAPGSARGGKIPTGGLTWCDYKEFIPISGINQVFGHNITRKDFPKHVYLGGDNYGLGTELDFYAIHQYGQIRVNNYSDVPTSIFNCEM